MKLDCAIAVFDEFGKAAEACRQLAKTNLNEQQISLVSHDVATEIPPAAAVPENEPPFVVSQSPTSVLESKAEEHDPGNDPLDPFDNLGTVLSLMNGEYSTGLVEADSGFDRTELSVSDYQAFVEQGSLLVVVTGTESDVEDASQTLIAAAAKQVNIHYAPELSR